MNKTSLTALAIAVVALVAAGFAVLKPAEVKLGSYTNGGVINGNAQVNNLVQGILGFSNTFSTSTALTPAQFCAGTNIRFIGTTALATATLPAATSSYLACTGGFGNFGAWSTQLVTNDSTNTVNIVAGAGQSFLCETQGPGTSTVVGGCTQTQFGLAASSTVQTIGYWDSGSSSQYILVGNNWFN